MFYGWKSHVPSSSSFYVAGYVVYEGKICRVHVFSIAGLMFGCTSANLLITCSLCARAYLVHMATASIF